MTGSKGKTVGILRETSCNYLANSEQNEQMKKHPSVRAIMNKLLKMFVFRKERGVEHRVIQNLRF
jgi:hypothetical protein